MEELRRICENSKRMGFKIPRNVEIVMFFTCLMGWFLTNCVFGGAELLLYDKTFFHWGDVLSVIFWGGL
jgi:hypothetical protein